MPEVLEGGGGAAVTIYCKLIQKLRLERGRSMIANRSLAVTVVPLVYFWSTDAVSKSASPAAWSLFMSAVTVGSSYQ